MHSSLALLVGHRHTCNVELRSLRRFPKNVACQLFFICRSSSSTSLSRSRFPSWSLLLICVKRAKAGMSRACCSRLATLGLSLKPALSWDRHAPPSPWPLLLGHLNICNVELRSLRADLKNSFCELFFICRSSSSARGVLGPSALWPIRWQQI